MPPKNFQAGLSPLSGMINNASYYTIPTYQRKYTWTPKKVERLWEDVVERYKDQDSPYDEYLLGSIVTVDRNGTQEVVDGQQRLVSLTLMFCALRDSLIKHHGRSTNDKAKARLEILITDINKKIHNKDNPMIKLNDNDDDLLFTAICRGDKPDEIRKLRHHASKSLGTNYDKLCHRSDLLCYELRLTDPNSHDIDMLRDIFNAVVAHVHVVYIIIKNEHDVYQIFQVLNSTGQPLTQSDLIKSYLMEKSPDVESAWIGVFAPFSKEILRNNKKSDAYIYDSFLSRNFPQSNIKDIVKNDLTKAPGDQNQPHSLERTKDVGKNDLYKAVVETVKNTKSAKELIGRLKVDVKIIHNLESPSAKNPLVHQLYGLKQVKAIYFRRPIIAAVRLWGWSDNRTYKLIDLLVKFFFMYKTVLKKDVDELRNISRDLTKQIVDGGDLVKVIDLYKTILRSVYKTNNDGSRDLEDFHTQFFEAFLTQKYRPDVIKYIFLSIEHSLQQNIDGPLSPFDIEHIFPQNPDTLAWPNHAQLEPLTNDIGNLTLLPSWWNKALRNYSFEIKKSGIKANGRAIHIKCPTGRDEKGNLITISYKNSKLNLNNDIQKYNKWDSSAITARRNLLRNYAKVIWDIRNYDNEIKRAKNT